MNFNKNLLILQPFHHVTYITAHSPTLPSLYLCHSSFSNTSVALSTSQLILQPLFCFSYITGSSLTSPGEPPMISAVASRCFLHPTLSLPSEQTLKVLKRSQGPHRGGEEIGFADWPSGLHRNSPQALNISFIRHFDHIRDPETPITLCPSSSICIINL